MIVSEVSVMTLALHANSTCVVRSVTHIQLAEEMSAGRATIFTLNMAHLHLLSGDHEFRETYCNATTITLDSNCLNRFFLGGRMTVATGSDFVRHLSSSGRLAGRSVLVIGNLSRDDAARLLPGSSVEVVRPPWGFIRDPLAVEALAEVCLRSDPDILFVAVGAPQSEKLALRLRRAGLSKASILCCGASFDFLLKTQSRSPDILQALGLEWLWRLVHDPRRLARRYLGDAAFLLSLFGQFWTLASTSRLRIGGLDLEFRDDREPIALARSAASIA